ncbi:MAG: hypothetical protein E6G57_12820, partial [Actinobacteria bacterium]
MKGGIAHRAALASVAALVASLFAPHVAHAATTPATTSNTATASASPHDATWTQPPVDMRAVTGAFKRSTSSSPSSTRTFEGTSAPNPCYYSIWSDPANDAPELDAVSYGALYDCPSGTWTFPVTTRDNWASSELDFGGVVFDTDNNPNDGNGGFDYVLVGIYDQGTLQAALIRTPDTNQNDWFVVSSAGITRSGSNQISFSIPNTSLGSPANLRWAGTLKGLSEQGEDDFPDSTAQGQPVHFEDGYTGSGCTVGVDASLTSQSYTVVDDPQAAAVALQAAGQPSVTATGTHPGVVHFSGDPARAGAILAGAGIPATVSADLSRRFQATTDDPDLGQQWSLNAVKAQQAWDVTTGSPAVVVADLDSGADGTHPDLAGKLVAGEDFTVNPAVPLSP